MAAASELSTALEAALRAAVSRARTYGKTWAEISDVLGGSRQAAFQRFGKPAGPLTATPADLLDASARAVTVLVAFIEGRFEDVRSGFDEVLCAELDFARLGKVRAGLTVRLGAHEGMGMPFARRSLEYLVVDVPLHFEAGPRTGRVAFDFDGRVAGFFVLAASEGDQR